MSNKPETKLIKQRKTEIAQVSVEAEIFALTQHFSDQMMAEMNQLLSIWGMTVLQHNALHALYVHDPEGKGLSGSELGPYLRTRVPDLTRLLDRLADKGWLVRERDKANRRVVRSRLTAIGVELVESVDSSLKALETKQLAHMEDTDKQIFKRLLEQALNPPQEPADTP